MSNSPPVHEVPAETAHPGGFPWHWIVLGMLVLAHAVFGAYCIPAVSMLTAMTLGVVISQPILLAIWPTFARQRYYHCILWSLLICTYLSFADDLGTVQRGMHFAPGQTILENLALYVVVLVSLFPVRRFARWQLAQPDEKDAPSVDLERNFGINHLLILTAIVALTCGLVRSLFIITDSGFPYSSVGQFIGSLGLLLVVSFPSSVVPWIILAPRRKPYWLIPITILLAGVLDVMAVAFMTKAAHMPLLPPVGVKWYLYYSPAFSYLWTQLGAIISIVVSTLVMRFCGFRMIRERNERA
jgi:hypothetical protein